MNKISFVHKCTFKYTDTNKYTNVFKIFLKSKYLLIVTLFILLTDSKSLTDSKIVKNCKKKNVGNQVSFSHSKEFRRTSKEKTINLLCMKIDGKKGKVFQLQNFQPKEEIWNY